MHLHQARAIITGAAHRLAAVAAVVTIAVAAAEAAVLTLLALPEVQAEGHIPEAVQVVAAHVLQEVVHLLRGAGKF